MANGVFSENNHNYKRGVSITGIICAINRITTINRKVLRVVHSWATQELDNIINMS